MSSNTTCEHTCSTCRWHQHESVDDGYVCVCDQSPHVTDWTEDDDSCEVWEARNERSAAVDALSKLVDWYAVGAAFGKSIERSLSALTEDECLEQELAKVQEQLAQAQEEIRRLDEREKQQSRRLDYALTQLHRRCPCETCAHGDGKGGCLIGGCTYTREDNLDLWTWNGWENRA